MKSNAMNTAKTVVGIIFAGLLIGLGLLLAGSNTQLFTANPAIAWLITLLGVFTASSTYRGMRVLGFAITGVGLYLILRTSDVVRFPWVRWLVAAALIVFGLMCLIQLLQQLREPSQT